MAEGSIVCGSMRILAPFCLPTSDSFLCLPSKHKESYDWRVKAYPYMLIMLLVLLINVTVNGCFLKKRQDAEKEPETNALSTDKEVEAKPSSSETKPKNTVTLEMKPQNGKPASPRTQSTKVVQPAPAKETGQESDGKPAQAPRSEPKQESSRESLPEFHGKEWLLPPEREYRLTPNDFKLGVLQDERTNELDKIKIVTRLRAFFNSLANGRIDEKSILPEWKNLLTRSMAYYVEKGFLPRSVLIGDINLQRIDSAFVKVRLIGESGKTEGEITLAKKTEEWYISDIQLDLRRLSEIYKPEEKFEPSTSRWMFDLR